MTGRARKAGRAALVTLLFLALLEAVLRIGVAVIAERTRGGAPGAKPTILCIGDSFTFGIKVAREEKYPALLERRINGDAGAATYRVVNLGRPGSSTGYVLSRLDQWLRRFRPRAVVIMSGWNCNDYDFAQHRERTGRGRAPLLVRVRRGLKSLAVWRLATYGFARMRRVSGEALYPEVMSMELYDFRDYQAIALANLERIVEKVRGKGVPLLLLTYPEARPPANPLTPTEYYHFIYGKTPIAEADYLLRDRRGKIAINAVIEEVARSRGVPLADNADAFRGRADADVFIPGDHHPNAAGNRIVADTVYEALRRSGILPAGPAPAAAPVRNP